MHDSPRSRRLRNDQVALERLATESSIFLFQASGTPPCHYRITFRGKGLCRDHGKIKLVHWHQVDIKLGASYPRNIPEIRWLTPIYHPNISEIGMVCLGGYGTHWVPSVQLDELCLMLWDMARYHNYDIRSPYNRDAALWVANQTSILFPTDARPLRDLRLAQGRVTAAEGDGKDPAWSADGSKGSKTNGRGSATSGLGRVRWLLEQYGRSRGATSQVEPEVAALRALSQPQAPAQPEDVRDGAPGPVGEEPANLALGTLVDPAPELPPHAEDEVHVLEEWTDSLPGPTRPAPGGDEIVFLE